MSTVVDLVMDDKVWGKTSCVYRNPTTEFHYIIAKQGGYCSRHKHRHKWNRFLVISGKLLVHYYKPGEDKPVFTYTLPPGSVLDVPPGIEHRFEAGENSQAIEVYWTNEIDPSDIERHDSGGVIDDTSSSR